MLPVEEVVREFAEHGVKDGERYTTYADVLDAFWRACCWQCVIKVRRNAAMYRLLPEE